MKKPEIGNGNKKRGNEETDRLAIIVVCTVPRVRQDQLRVERHFYTGQKPSSKPGSAVRQLKMTDYINLTLEDGQSGDSFGLPDSPACTIQQAADDDFCKSDSEYPLVKNEPADSDMSSVVIVSNDSTSELRYAPVCSHVLLNTNRNLLHVVFNVTCVLTHHTMMIRMMI